jgi:hypothetical protein
MTCMITQKKHLKNSLSLSLRKQNMILFDKIKRKQNLIKLVYPSIIFGELYYQF